MADCLSKTKVLQRTLQLFSLLTMVSLQLNGLLFCYNLYQKQIQEKVLLYYGRKRSLYFKKLKIMHIRRMNRRKRSVWVANGRTDLWWRNLITGVSPDNAWKKNFRMNRETFQELCEQLRPFVSPKESCPNYRRLSLEKKVAVTLYFLKDTGSMWMTANTFGIHQCTVSKIVIEVCTAITDHLNYIKLPTTVNEMQEKVAQYELKYCMTQAFGCIDGTHIPIRAPLKDSSDYFNYKQFFSLNVQAVCDYKGLFMDVECRWPGSAHDAKVYANSKVSHKLRSGDLPKTFNTLVPNFRKVPNYLIGDPAYPLTPTCIKEFYSCKNNAEVVFNSMLRAARNPIECAFGRLKARWRILTRKIDLNIHFVPTLVIACFQLHNFCEYRKSYLDEKEISRQIEYNNSEEALHKHLPDPVYSSTNTEDIVVREILKT